MGTKSGSQPNPYAPNGSNPHGWSNAIQPILGMTYDLVHGLIQKGSGQQVTHPFWDSVFPNGPHSAQVGQPNPNAIAMNPAYIPGADPRQFTQTMPVQAQPMQQGNNPDMRRQMMAQMLASRPFQNPNLNASNQANLNQMAY